MLPGKINRTVETTPVQNHRQLLVKYIDARGNHKTF
ncbi:hypothetical protein T4C_13506 [Trichinella pseudospiralis]|uniref:Uncharacterized protein n=1 Tax=Trichinella pseudospiralis TaxID=6337 RepID=A0A0V1GAX1_TRIPS|nr:hypothetical protein T4C_13506 [Trichinella pseudospiralis]